MRFGISNPGSENYFCEEVFLNNLKLVPINLNTERALAVAVVDSNGNQVTPGVVGAATCTNANVAGSASSVTLIASNTSRKGFTIFNDSDAILYVKLGSTASTSSFNYRLTPYGILEAVGPTVYTGVIDGIWASATGAARIGELT